MAMSFVEFLPRDREGLPRPCGDELAERDLLPADVLLSRGSSAISDAIVAADGGSYSHAALWSGAGVIEATLEGAHERPLTFERDVYRYRHGAERLPPSVADAIVSTARRQLELPYAESELVLLGLLYLHGHMPKRSLLNLGLSLIGRDAAEDLEDWLALQLDGRSSRVCSELVALSYYRACRSRRYALRILPRAERPVSAACTSSADQSQSASKPQERKLLAGNVAVSATTHRPVPVVTPADLQFSPSLQYVGRLSASVASAQDAED